ncbi:hypothetical protein SHELI_v1c10900 [Spiroplasma helicoides]|uniref:Uncharacterized protein n=1 Tax=Spiroplasma helicoides TaxID=216938 RepID=A0A1B3SM93_9MOLU|nr:hypothetical protein [Spiroplasma helicoides]AOG61037.1 hypothetical protein SHELI_v1c10900 [Spiroplasma helicoides]
MQKQIQPIKYEEIIINVVNDFYLNIKSNINNDLIPPEKMQALFNEVNEIKTRDDIEKLGKTFDETFKQWKPINEDEDKKIIIRHIICVLQNAMVVILSVEKNLQKEELPSDSIIGMSGLDILITTAVQALSVKSNELTELYEKLKKEDQSVEIYKNINNHLKTVNQSEAQKAFTNLIQNIIDYCDSYLNCYEILGKENPESWTNQRVSLLVEYMNAFYLFNFFLRLALTYPLQEGMMAKEIYNRIIPPINIY